MATLTFEDLGDDHFTVQGTANVYEVTTPRNPATIIRLDQAWRVEFDWRSEGPDNHVIGGDWQLKIYLERMGGLEFSFTPPTGEATEPLRPALNYSQYTEYIEIPANTVNEAGLYKLVASITHTGLDASGNPSRVAGFAEGPLLQFYEVKP